MTSDRFSGRTIIVTGAGSGIGRGVAETVVEEGAQVVLADISSSIEQLAETLEGKGHRALAVRTDVTDNDAVEAMVDTTLERFGRVDGLVVAAGGFPGRIAVEDIDAKQWDQGLQLNLSSAFYSCHAVIPAMKSQQSGSIVMVSSAAGRALNNPATAYYAAGKSGMLGLARHLALELGPEGIRVNSVAPGTTITPRIEQMYDEDRLEVIRAKTPLGRIAEVDDQVGPILFLLSDASRYMTGTCLDVSGGRIMM